MRCFVHTYKNGSKVAPTIQHFLNINNEQEERVFFSAHTQTDWFQPFFFSLSLSGPQFFLHASIWKKKMLKPLHFIADLNWHTSKDNHQTNDNRFCDIAAKQQIITDTWCNQCFLDTQKNSFFWIQEFNPKKNQFVQTS